MAVPDYQALMLPVLSASSNGEVRISDVRSTLAEQLELTPEDREKLLPSGRQGLFENRVHWAKFYLGKAGLIERTRRGHFRITTRGQQVLNSHPAKIDNDFLNKFEEFRQFEEKSAEGTTQDQLPIEAVPASTAFANCRLDQAASAGSSRPMPYRHFGTTSEALQPSM